MTVLKQPYVIKFNSFTDLSLIVDQLNSEGVDIASINPKVSKLLVRRDKAVCSTRMRIPSNAKSYTVNEWIEKYPKLAVKVEPPFSLQTTVSVRYSGGISTYTFQCAPKRLTNNCKISSITGLAQTLSSLVYSQKSQEIIEEVIKKFLKVQYATIFGTVGKEEDMELIRKYFKLLYQVKVPIGYGGRSQIHFLIDNPYNSTRNEYLRNEPCELL